jgi:ubiquinone/menaquinone biosynthesis C-methylase UbiE
MAARMNRTSKQWIRTKMKSDKRRVDQARRQFNQDLHSPQYSRIVSNETHLEQLLAAAPVRDNGVYLDWGTGSGYVAFALAQRHSSASIFGLDVADEALACNRKLAVQNGLRNIQFEGYDGFAVPYASAFFDGIFCRHALHHFPRIEESIAQMARILKPGGFAVIADCTPRAVDSAHWIDRFMQLRQDGHVRFYTRSELGSWFVQQGMRLTNHFEGEIRFPRPLDERYRNLVENASPELIAAYALEMQENSVFITLPILNLVFEKI